MVTVGHRTQNRIALAGLVGEHLESSSMVMGHTGVQSQACIQPFAVAVLAVVAVELAPVDLSHRPIPIDLISMVENTSKLRPLEVTVVVEVR